ncbi:MAG: hypothetical protein IJF48_02225 [Clostridia bacterium]|nr:hypothetical protein [Clostridia bacterium]
MKFTRILTLALAVAMLALTMASCGGAATTAVTLKITVPSEADASVNEQIVDAKIEVTGKNPTVLDVIAIASERCDFQYTTNSSGTSVEEFAGYPRYTDEATGINYSWYFTINGEEPSGSAADNVVAADDVIEYIYVAYDPSAE